MRTTLVHFNHLTDGDHTTWPDMRAWSWKPNYGDMLVCSAIIRQLDLQETTRINFGEESHEKSDRSIMRGSTYLHNEFDFEAANRTIDSLDQPIAVVGLGAQNPVQDVTFLDGNPAARDFIARLSERSASISVRGAFSAAVVERLGAKNIRVTGCPSLFYTLKCPAVRVPEMLSRPERSIGVSLHSGLSPDIFCHDPVRALMYHRFVIGWGLNNAANLVLFEQGVPFEFDIADRHLPFPEREAQAHKMHGILDGSYHFTPYDLIARMVSVRSVEDWLARAGALDAIIGFRFHGNMVALLQSSPCYYYTYDSRISEFCSLYGLPAQDVSEDWRNPVDAMLNHDWSEVNARIRSCFRELRDFYAENGFRDNFSEPG